jgi:hypothetical protein
LSKKLNPKIIRIGDKVRILEPNLFVRCGYPLCLDDMRKIVVRDHSGNIENLLKLVGEVSSITFLEDNDNPSREFDKIRDVLAYILLKKKHFGGTRRSIHTEVNEKLRGKIVEVIDIFFVKTGTYSPDSYYSWDGEYEPPYLANEETHKILSFDKLENIYPSNYKFPAIEACWVNKVK